MKFAYLFALCWLVIGSAIYFMYCALFKAHSKSIFEKGVPLWCKVVLSVVLPIFIPLFVVYDLIVAIVKRITGRW